ncbi:MAG: fructosamine kinase family protein [Myxococcales bacterium]|nr:fructosamine kinase family protein [Myxococcales bacterium]
MNGELSAALSAALEAALGARVVAAGAVGGGDINDAYRASLSDGRVLFVKTHARAPAGMFAAEARGLRWLRDAGALRVPEVCACADRGEAEREHGPWFLALEWVEPAPRAPDFDERLGRGLATLHRAGAPRFGLDADNFIGTLAQRNAPLPTWADFYRERRLRPQMERARERGLLPGRLLRELERVAAQMERLVGPEEPPARLHGDLWGGNVHVDERGAPCLIDPAVYGGHREVDLAMLRLFGGVSPRLMAAYEEVSPLAPGADERVALYQLYPLLVHVNLFGGGYVGSLEGALRRVL